VVEEWCFNGKDLALKHDDLSSTFVDSVFECGENIQ
jgi:hypothetical protein